MQLDLHDGAATKWLGLEVKRQKPTGEDSAIVEFVARYKIGGRAFRLEGTSRFVRMASFRYYVDADTGR